jgi:hypothetical protein
VLELSVDVVVVTGGGGGGATVWVVVCESFETPLGSRYVVDFDSTLFP